MRKGRQTSLFDVPLATSGTELAKHEETPQKQYQRSTARHRQLLVCKSIPQQGGEWRWHRRYGS